MSNKDLLEKPTFPLLYGDGIDISIWLRLNEFPTPFSRAIIFRSWANLQENEPRDSYHMVSQDGEWGFYGMWTAFITIADGEAEKAADKKTEAWARKFKSDKGPSLLEFAGLDTQDSATRVVLNLLEDNGNVLKSLGVV